MEGFRLRHPRLCVAWSVLWRSALALYSVFTALFLLLTAGLSLLSGPGGGLSQAQAADVRLVRTAMAALLAYWLLLAAWAAFGPVLLRWGGALRRTFGEARPGPPSERESSWMLAAGVASAALHAAAGIGWAVLLAVALQRGMALPSAVSATLAGLAFSAYLAWRSRERWRQARAARRAEEVAAAQQVLAAAQRQGGVSGSATSWEPAADPDTPPVGQAPAGPCSVHWSDLEHGPTVWASLGYACVAVLAGVLTLGVVGRTAVLLGGGMPLIVPAAMTFYWLGIFAWAVSGLVVSRPALSVGRHSPLERALEPVPWGLVLHGSALVVFGLVTATLSARTGGEAGGLILLELLTAACFVCAEPLRMVVRGSVRRPAV